MGLKVSVEEEFSGMDMPKFGLAAYTEFVHKRSYDHEIGNSERRKKCSVWETSYSIVKHLFKGVLSVQGAALSVTSAKSNSSFS